MERAGMFLEASSETDDQPSDNMPSNESSDSWRVERGRGGRVSHVVVCGIELAVREGGPLG